MDSFCEILLPNKRLKAAPARLLAFHLRFQQRQGQAWLRQEGLPAGECVAITMLASIRRSTADNGQMMSRWPCVPSQLARQRWASWRGSCTYHSRTGHWSLTPLQLMANLHKAVIALLWTCLKDRTVNQEVTPRVLLCRELSCSTSTSTTTVTDLVTSSSAWEDYVTMRLDRVRTDGYPNTWNPRRPG